MSDTVDDHAYDRARLVELFGNDPKTIAEVENDFLATARGTEQEIMSASDCAVIARAAHRLKGASGMIGAAALGHMAEELERAAKDSDLSGVRRMHGAFSEEVRRVARQVGRSVG